MEGDLVIVDQAHSDGPEKQPPKKYALKKIILIWTALFILLMLLGAGYAYFKERVGSTQQLPGTDSDVRAAAGMNRFTSYEELAAFMEENESSFVGSRSGSKSTALNQTTWSEVASTPADTTAGWGAASAPSGVPTDASDEYSQTNIQVAGVDEGDIVKTDGEYIYAISGQMVVIMKAKPAEETEIVSKIELGYSPTGLYISGDKLAVFGTGYDIKPLKDYSLLPGGRADNYADLRIYDISDRKSPTQLKQYDFEGSYSNSRLIGDYLYLVTASYPDWVYYTDVRPIPYVLEDGTISVLPQQPQVYYFDFPYSSQNFTSITAVNLRDLSQDLSSETYVLDGNQNTMYVSTENLYVTFNKRVSENELALAVIKEFVLPRLEAKEQERIKEIESAKGYILSPDEKTEKILEVFERYYESLPDEEQDALTDELEVKMKEKYESMAGEMQKTIIHKIGVKDGALSYVAKGEVQGRVLNQYAMDEDSEGNFRIATTVDANRSGITDTSNKSYNNLYVLDKGMKRLGALEKIAEGESIYSVRFMGERAYMVTFKRTDPLFVIGLRYPDKPVVLGELKVPGYSTYLHPYDENLLIGLGKNADERGRETGGIKLSLFDATDVSSPKEVESYVFGDYGSSSTAINDPKAFLFSKEKNLLVIPAVVRKSDLTDRYSSKAEVAGSAVFKVDATGFELKGYVDHRSESQKSSNYYYAGDAKRSLYIGDNLYTISDNYLKVNALNDLREVKSVALPGGGRYYGWGE